MQGLSIDEVKQLIGDLVIDFRLKEKQYVEYINTKEAEIKELKQQLEAAKPEATLD